MLNMWHSLTEIFTYPFMRQALFLALVLSAAGALLSCYLILKGWALVGDAVSHAVLPGIVVAYLLGIPLILGALTTGLLCTLGTGWLKEKSILHEDTALGITFTGLFALGIIMFTKIETSAHLMHILFGDLLGVEPAEYRQSLIISALCLLFLIIKQRDLTAYIFDKTQATVSGLAVNFLYWGLLITLALTVVSAMQVVGVILVIGLLITPGMTGFILAKSFTSMRFIALIHAVGSCFLGLIISFYLDSSPGPTIVVCQALLFLAALAGVSFKNAVRAGKIKQPA